MNRVYRLVYNRTLGVWQVASELVKAAQGGRSSGGGLATAALHPMSFGLWLMMGWVGLVLPVTAQQAPTVQPGRIIADPNAPKQQRPTVVTSANGTPQVNITTPSAAGVSRNTYSQFDVGSDGAILNNSRGNVQTQLGGWVPGNPWLAKGTARVILNEVNSADPSQLRGYVEVAGDRAQVVIANPAGISVDGGGFLNASRVTLSTGTAIVNAGVLDGYRVDGGAIRISGAGLDATDSDYTDIISRSLEVNAGIWAQQLQASLGSNVVTADHGQVRPQAASGNTPAFALDVGALGGMYANKIWLVGNEHGMGMRNAGSIGAQAGELVVTAQGRLENSGALQSQQDTKLSATGGVANSGTVSAAREVLISTAADLDNSGGTLNARRVEVNADSLRNDGGAIEQVGAQLLDVSAGTLSNRNDGRIGVVASAATGGGSDGGTGTGSGGGSEGGTGGGTTPGEGGTGGGTATPPLTPLAAGALNIANALNNDGGRIDALGAVSIRAQAGLDNSGGKMGVTALKLQGGDLRNIAGNLAVQDADLRAGSVDNSQGQFNIAGSFLLNAATLLNRGGSIAHGGSAASTWTVAGAVDNSGGTLASNATALRLQAGALTNAQGTISHAGTQGLWLSTGNMEGRGGTVVTSGALTLAAAAVDHRNATLSATQITLDADAFDNRAGTLLATGADANILQVRGVLDNGGGTLASNGDLTISASELGNAAGTVQHAGEGTLAINAATLAGHGGSLVSNGSLNITGKTTDLRDGTTSAQRIAISADTLITAGGQLAATSTDVLKLQVHQRLDNTGGTIGSNGALALSAANFINDAGKLIAAGNEASSIRVAQSLENRSGTVSSNGALQIDAGQLVNAGGSVVVAEGADLSLMVGTLLDNSAGGRLAAGGDMHLQAARLDNRRGVIEHAGEGGLNVAVTELLGADGSMVSNGNLSLEGDAIDLQGATTQARKLKITANALTTAQGSVVSTGSDALQLQVRDALNNDGGAIAANGALALSAGTLSNRQGTLSSAGTAASSIDVSGQLDNTSGSIASNADLLGLSSGSLVNAQGMISHAGSQELQLTTGKLDGQQGSIVTAAALTLNAGAVDHRAATLNANQLTLNAAAFDNRGGSLVMTGDQANTLDVQGLLDNGDGGALASNGDLTLRAASFGNAAGTVQHAGSGTLAITAATLAGNAGSLLSNGSLNISGQVTDLRDGTTSAQRINVQTGDLTTAGGQLASTSTDALLLQVRNRLDNSGGSIGSNGGIDLRAATFVNNQGTVQAPGVAASSVVVSGAMENRGGIVVTAGDTTVQAKALDNRGGTLHVAGDSTLALSVDGLLDNRQQGTVSSGGDAVVTAGRLDNTQGTVAAAQALTLTSQAGIDNAGGIVQAGQELQLSADGLANAGGNVIAAKATIDTRGQLLDNSDGTIASLEDGLTINSGTLQNNAGLIQSAAALVVDTGAQSLLNRDSGSAGIVSAGTLAIRSGALDNRNGVVFAQGNAQLDATNIDNRQGGSMVGAADLTLRAQSLANATGVVKAGGNATVDVRGALDNQAGLVAANGELVLNAATVDNRNTAVAGQALGLQAGAVEVTAQSLDNRQGQVIADGNAELVLTGGLNNAAGQVSTGNRLDIRADTVLNTAGTLVSGGDQALTARNLSGDGKVLAQGDATLVLDESFTNSGELVANGALSLTSKGNVDNLGKIQGGAVAVRAENISNAAEGEISSLGVTQLSATGKVVNRGLIDGGTTHIVVDTLENTGSGRIYGDHVAIQARELLNRAETLAGVATSATIAARDRLDLAAAHLSNSGESLIYSGGDAAIGRVLDVNRLATGTAQQVDNLSSIIEVGGNLAINALAVNNIRQNVSVEQVRTVDAPVRLDQPSWFKNGSNGNSDYTTTSNYAAYEVYYLNADDILEDTPYITPDGYVIRRAVVRMTAQTSAYLFGRGGLHGARGGRSRLVMQDGTVTIYYIARRDGKANPDQVTTGADDPFRELIPSEPGAPAFRYEEDNLNYSSAYGTCTTNCVQLTAMYQYTDPDHMLTEMRRDPKNTADNEQYRIATHSIVEDVVSSAGADAIINAGGNMRIDTDALLNQYGRIAAGGNLDIVGVSRDTASVSNIGLSLYRTHSFSNTSYTYRGGSSSWTNPDISELAGQLGGVLSAGGTLSVDVGDLSNLNDGRDAPNVQDGAGLANLNTQGPGAGTVGPGAGQAQGPGVVKGQTAANANANGPDAAQTGTGNTVDTQGTTGLGRTTAVRANGDGADTIVTATIDGKAPSGSLFKVDANRGQYLVETDPRFADYRNWLSSDHLLAQMGFDPATTQKRLGDGFYEQKLVREQIGELTGRRFLDGYASDEEQYRALLEAGATVASSWGLRPGIALTAAQMAQLTSDIVWLVEQTITLADGSTTTALVPQVYLRVQAGDLSNNGALLAGANVDLKLRGDFVNQGDVAGRQLVSIDAGNIRNLAGANISGQQVGLQARQDIEIIGSKVTATDALSVKAGGDITVASTTRSWESAGSHAQSSTSIDRVAGLYVTSPSGIGALSVNAGGDVTLTGAQVANAGTQGVTVLAAGGNLNLETIAEQRSLDVTSDSRNYLRTSQTTHVGSTVNGVGDVVLEAGNDVNLAAANISAGNAIAVQAGRDINSSVAVDVATFDSSSAGKKSSRAVSASDDTVQGTQIAAGGNIVLQAGRDLTLQAATVASDEGGIGVSAGRDVNLTAAQEQHDLTIEEQRKKSGVLKTKTTATLDSWSDSIAVTTTLSGETVTVAAGRDLTSQGAQIAGTGDVLLAAGRDVILGVAENTHTEVHDKTVTKSGLFSGGGVGFTIGKQQTDTTADIAEKTHTGSLIGSTDGRVDIAAGRDVTITGSDVLSREGIGIIGQNVTIQAAEDSTSVTETQKFKQAGINVSLKGGAVDTAMAVKNSVERASEAKDDRLSALHAAKAGQTLFSSGGAGMSSLKGMGDQIGQAKADIANEEQTAGGLSLRIGIGASKSSSSTEYTASTSSGSRIASEGDVVIQATGDGQGNGGDLKIIGSKIEGDNVALAAANDLILKSQQETRQQIERSKSSSGEIGITIGSEAGFGVYVAASAAKGKGDGSGTTHAETTIDATNTLTMISGRDMTLEGAQARGKTVIADVGRDLTLISQQDSNDYKRKDVSGGIDVAVGTGGASVSANFNQSKIDSTYTSVKEQTGIQAGEGGFDIYVGGHTQLTGAAIASTADPSRNHLSTGSLSVEDMKNEAAYKASSIGISVSGSSSGGMNAPAPSVSIPQSEKASSVTRGDIAAGTVEVRNGDSNALEGLDRTATVLQQDGLKEIFDQLKVQERLEMGQVAAEVGMRTAGDIAQKMGWEEGSKEKVLLHGAVGAAIAALGGGSALDGLSGAAASQLASGAVLNYLGSNNIIPDSAEGTALIELASIAIGAAVGGGSGAATALAGEQFNRQLHVDESKKLAALKEGKDDAQKQRLDDAMCALTLCSVGVADSDPYKAVLVASEERGRTYLAEQQQIKQANVFNGYTSVDAYNDWLLRNDETIGRLVNGGRGVAGAWGAAGGLAGAVATVPACTTIAGCVVPIGLTGLAGLSAADSFESFNKMLADYNYVQGQRVIGSFSPETHWGEQSPVKEFGLAGAVTIYELVLGKLGAKMLPPLVSKEAGVVADGRGSHPSNPAGGSSKPPPLGEANNVSLGTPDRMLPEADFAGRVPVRTDIEQHLINGEVSRRQIAGAHNMHSFEDILRDAGGTMSKVELSPGIYEVSYRLPKFANGPMQKKTVYDPAIYSDERMAGMAAEAANRGGLGYAANGNVTQIVRVGDVKFNVTVKVDQNGRAVGVRTVYPISD